MVATAGSVPAAEGRSRGSVDAATASEAINPVAGFHAS
jgi:hypothetical protein